MAISREVLGKVPGFDIELGAGALGTSEETLFAAQLRQAGYPICSRLDVCVEHHFQPSRLNRDAWLEAAAKQGASLAYCGHHWEHWGCRIARLRWLLAVWNLSQWRKLHHAQMAAEGCHEQELMLLVQKATACAHLTERQRPRNYDRHGLNRIR